MSATFEAGSTARTQRHRTSARRGTPARRARLSVWMLVLAAMLASCAAPAGSATPTGLEATGLDAERSVEPGTASATSRDPEPGDGSANASPTPRNAEPGAESPATALPTPLPLSGGATPSPAVAPATLAPIASATAPTQPTASPTLPAGGSEGSPAAMLGVGLRRQTAPIVLKYGDRPGLVMCATVGLAADHFPKLDGWIRVLGAPSLAALRDKAEEARRRGVPYEALAYGLETGAGTPDEEWQDLAGSTARARALADEYGKLLVMAPGFRLMSGNSQMYPRMAALADIWVLQTQRLQLDPPGSTYRAGVQAVVEQIRAGSPGIAVWAQITLPPDREPDAGEWLAYRQSIVDLVDGAYIGVYTWDVAGEAELIAAIDAILAAALEEKE